MFLVYKRKKIGKFSYKFKKKIIPYNTKHAAEYETIIKSNKTIFKLLKLYSELKLKTNKLPEN